MAKKRKIELQPPLGGLSENFAFEVKPPYTSPSLCNVRPYDPDRTRARIGQRPAVVKAYDQQVSGNSPVVALAQITTTYIPPEQ